MVYQRPILRKIVRRLKEPRRFLQVLVGPRQVGKTTLARQAMEGFGERWIGMQRISVTAQRADGESAIFELELELAERMAIVEHRERAVRIARVVAGAQFHGVDIQAVQFIEDLG